MKDQNPRYVSKATKKTFALILAGGRGSRLYELTEWRAKPALYFGGKYRIIDFPLSNCINSGVRKVGVLTQYKAHSLMRHVIRGWGHFKKELGEFVEILPASQRYSSNWYEGTADAIYQNIDIIRAEKPEYILVLSGDHVYKMDYGPMLVDHIESGAKMSVCCLEVPTEEAAGAFGVMQVNESNRVIGFQEKPEHPAEVPGKPGMALASMGNYIFDAEFLIDELIKDANTEDSTHDFGNDIIPKLIEETHIQAYSFTAPDSDERAYWRDVGTLDSYWLANMEMIQTTPLFDIYGPDWPVWTYPEQLPPAKFVFDSDDRRGMAVDSMVSGGCIVSGCEVRRSVLFSNVHIESYSTVEECVILPSCRIGRNVKIRKAIIDRGVSIPDGMEIGYDKKQDEDRGFRVTEKGVVLVTRSMMGQKGGYV